MRLSSLLNVFRARSVSVLLAGAVTIPYAALIGQTRQFEIISIKPVGHEVPAHYSGGPGTSDPGRLSITRTSLKDLIVEAYFSEYGERIVGPDSLNADYSVAATMAPTTTKKEMCEMFATMLKDRFALRFHEEQRPVSAYKLTIAAGGSTLKPDSGGVPSTTESSPARGTPVTLDSTGYPTVPPGFMWRVTADSNGVRKYAFRACSMRQVADMLSLVYTRGDIPVLDSTGLSGLYTFRLALPSVARVPSRGLDAQPAAELSGDLSLGSVSGFLEKQVGLTLVASKPLFKFMIVDHIANRPTDN